MICFDKNQSENRTKIGDKPTIKCKKAKDDVEERNTIGTTCMDIKIQNGCSDTMLEHRET